VKHIYALNLPVGVEREIIRHTYEVANRG
jgi:hypothetical protein